ncbi:MAG: hypothetical protein Q9170_003566 [Blastenia crenularia]
MNISSLLLLFLASNGLAATDCFTQIGDTYTKPSIVTNRVSVGLSCPLSQNNLTCLLPTGGLVTEFSTLNFTSDSENQIFQTVGKVTNTMFDTVKGSVTNFSYNVDPGAMGYYGFTSTLNCYAGTLGDCIGGNITAGSAVEACEPRKLAGSSNSRYPELDGMGAFVKTDSIADMSTNPSNQSSTDSSSGSAGTAMQSMSHFGALGTLVVGVLVWQFY